jgi:hypothetical protein
MSSAELYRAQGVMPIRSDAEYRLLARGRLPFFDLWAVAIMDKRKPGFSDVILRYLSNDRRAGLSKPLHDGLHRHDGAQNSDATVWGTEDALTVSFTRRYQRGTVLAPLDDALSTAVYANLPPSCLKPQDLVAMNRVAMNEGTQRLAGFAQTLEECVFLPSGQWRPP